MSGSKSKGGGEDKQDVFQAVLLADNFEDYLFGEHCPYLPEGLVPLCNRRMIDYSLEALASSGVNEIFVYSSRNTSDLKAYLKQSEWLQSPVAITVITSEGSQSLGDALRVLDKKAVLRNDFILMNAGVITNIPLRPLLDKHRATVAKDKGAVMTLVHRKMSVGHRSRSRVDNPIVIIDSKSNKIISYRSGAGGKKLSIPVESLQAEMELFMDTCDTGIAICSAAVPPLFEDNFDFVNLNDLIRGILINEEITGNSLYFHRVESGYAACITDFEAFKGVSLDILQRWTYPLVPDMPFGPSTDFISYPFNYNFTYRGNSIKMGHGTIVGPLVVVGHGSEIGKASTIVNSSLGDNCKIGSGVIIRNSFISNNVTIGDDCSLYEVIVEEGVKIPNDSEYKPWVLIGDKQRRIQLPIQEEVIESSSGSVSSEQGQVKDDVEFEMFVAEVLESLQRGYQEGVATENLVLEINSSKFAYNMSSKQVTMGLIKGMLELVPKLHPDFAEDTSVKSQWQKQEAVVLKFKELLEHYVKTEESQSDLLNALEEYSNDHVYFRPLLLHALHCLYHQDILMEEPIMEWYNKNSLYEAGVELRTLVKKFIDWLEAAESEDSDT